MKVTLMKTTMMASHHVTIQVVVMMMMMILHATFHLSNAEASSFIERPRNTSSLKGRDITMRCRIVGDVMWMKDEQLLGLDDREMKAYPRYTVVGDEAMGEHHLNIKGVTIEDEGWFSCVGTSGDVSKAYLNVVVQPDSPIIKEHTNGDVITFDGSQTHLHLRCSSGFSKPPSRLIWRKNGVDVEENQFQERISRGGFKESLSNSESFLTFHPSPLDDGVMVECVSIYPGSFKNKTTGVKLVVYYPPAKVEIVGLREGEPLISGSSHVVTCHSTGGNPLPTLTWKKDNSVVPDQKQIVSGRKVISKINLLLTPGDNGATLICEATSHASASVITPLKLTVHFSPTHVQILPQIIGRLKSHDDREQLIQCRSGSSNPKAKISWHLVKNEAHCDPEPLTDFTEVIEDGDCRGYVTASQLRFLPRIQDHGAKIVCRAHNPLAGMAINSSVQLDVNYKPFIRGKKNFTVVEGSTASLNVLVEANPQVNSFTWIRNQMTIGPITSRVPVTFLQNDMRFSGGVKNIMSDDNGHHSTDSIQTAHILQEAWLNVSQVSREDAGVYKCQAVNNEGRSEVEVHLDVYYPAFITNYLSTPEAVEGSLAKFECKYKGNPPPKIVQWFRNGVEVLPLRGDDVIITTMDEGYHNGRSVLEYRSVKQDQMGVHRCKVDNEVNEEFDLSNEMRLVVQHKPKIDKSPINRKAASDLNGTAKLMCRTHGIPHVEFSWIKQINDTLPAGHFKHDNVPTLYADSPVLIPTNYSQESVLEIFNVQQKDYGVYYCKAENSLGSDDFQIHLGRPGVPDLPYNLQVINSTHDSITISWNAGFDGGARQTFMVKCLENGGSPDESTDEALVENVTSPLETVVYTMRGLKLGTDYWVTVTSFNKYGQSSEVTPKPMHAYTSATAPVSDKNSIYIDTSILVYALTSLAIVVVVVISIFCLVKKTRNKSFKDPSRCMKGTLGNMGQSSKMSSVETTTTNATLDLIGAPSLVDDLHFKTLDSLNSSNVNFANVGHADYTAAMTMLPKYGCNYDRMSHTHSTCDVNKCSDYRPYTDDDMYNTTRRYHNNYTPTSSLLSASRTKITVNPIHLLPSCVTDATDSMLNRQNVRSSDLQGTCYMPINSCMTSSAVLPDLHNNSCAYRPNNELYPFNSINNTSRNYSPEQHSPFQPSSTAAYHYALPPELRGHLV